MIKRNYLSIFALFLAASVTLTACDTNEADDTQVTGEVTTQTTTITIAPSDPVVTTINNTVATQLGGVVGDNIVVDNSAGAVTQTTTTSTVSTGSQTTSTATIAPLVNQTTGQPTGQVVVQSQTQSTGQAATTQTVVVAANTSNASNVSTTSTSTTGVSTDLSLDAGFNPDGLSASNGNSVWLASRNYLRNALGNSYTPAADDVEAGTSYAEFLQAAIAAGKRNTTAAAFARFQDKVYTDFVSFSIAILGGCSLNNSATTTFDLVIQGSSSTFDCNDIAAVFSASNAFLTYNN